MRKRAAVAEACGLVQVVRLHWDKSARGGPGARDRNAVPQAFAVPAADLDSADGHLCVGLTHWGDRNAFAEPFSARRERVAVADGFKFGCVGVSPHPDGLEVRYQYNQADGGAPDRWYFNWSSGYGESPGRSLVVRPSQWVRVCYNGRFSCIDSGSGGISRSRSMWRGSPASRTDGCSSTASRPRNYGCWPTSGRPQTPNQALQQTAGAILVSGISSSSWPPPLLSGVVRVNLTEQ